MSHISLTKSLLFTLCVTQSIKPVTSLILLCSFLSCSCSLYMPTLTRLLFFVPHLLTPCIQGKHMWINTRVLCKGMQMSKRIFRGFFTWSCMSDPFHIRYPSQTMSNPCLTPVGWCMLTHSDWAHIGLTRITVLVSRRGDEVGCVCILLPAHACVIIAERKQRVEKAHIKPSTVYLRSQ